MKRRHTTAKDVHLGKHILFFWPGTPIGLGLLTWFTLRWAGGDSGEVVTGTVVAVLTGIATGWLVGIIAWVLHWGTRGWIDVGRSIRAQHRDADGQQELDAYLARANQPHGTNHPTPGASASPDPTDPWNGTNPYGCCRYNVDENGYPTHGGPDCMHPMAGLYEN